MSGTICRSVRSVGHAARRVDSVEYLGLYRPFKTKSSQLLFRKGFWLVPVGSIDSITIDQQGNAIDRWCTHRPTALNQYKRVYPTPTVSSYCALHALKRLTDSWASLINSTPMHGQVKGYVEQSERQTWPYAHSNTNNVSPCTLPPPSVGVSRCLWDILWTVLKSWNL